MGMKILTVLMLGVALSALPAGMAMPGQTAPAPSGSVPTEVAEIVSPGADDIALTIYRDNLAFITETRTVTLPRGRAQISFAGVSDLIIPQTVILREFGAVTLERNFDYDLLSQGSLLKKSVGSTVYITRTDPATGKVIEREAIIVSAGRGMVFDIDGRIEAFDCSGLPEKISFDAVPDGLRAEPTLSIEVSAQEAGPQTFTISYLASGFDWQADYILRLQEDGKADLTGWLTLVNSTAVSVSNAPTAIVAGELQRLWETAADKTEATHFAAACWPRGSTKTGITGRERDQETVIVTGSRMRRDEFLPVPLLRENSVSAEAEPAESKAVREDLGDYKLFRTPEPTTVASYQTKQILFLRKPAIDITRIHAFERDPYQASNHTGSDLEIAPAILRYDINNEPDGALGEPLPAGTVRVMSNAGAAGLFYLGEDSVRDLAVGLPVEVDIGQSPSVVIETVIVNVTSKRLRDGSRRYTGVLRHEVKNANGYSVLAEISENKSGYSGPVTVVRASRRQVADSPYPKWQFEVPANGVARLDYTIEWVQ